jgi:hypothetical protein
MRWYIDVNFTYATESVHKTDGDLTKQARQKEIEDVRQPPMSAP